MTIATVDDRYSAEQIHQFYSAGLWKTETLWDELEKQVALHADKPFMIDDSTQLTFAQTRDRALQIAEGLVAIGITPGSRIAVQLPNWVEFAPIVLAISRIGAVAVPIQPIYRDSEVAHIVETAEVSVVFTAGTFRGFDYSEMYERLSASAPTLSQVISVRAADARFATWTLEELSTLRAECLPAAARADDPFAIIFSSGTTSKAKGCLHTLNTARTPAIVQGEAYHYTADDIQFGPSPLTHTTGIMSSFLMPLIHGATSVVMARWDPNEGLKQIERFRCTGTINASTFLHTLLAAHDPTRHDLTSMRYWTLAGAPIPASLVERAQEAMPALRVLSQYGRTENMTTTMCAIDDDPSRSLTSDGRALRGQEVVVLGPGDEVLEPGREGEIAYRGSMSLLRYVGMPEETAEMFTAEGYSKSGDLGVMDSDGFLRVTGRLKDIVVRGGLNISVRQVEDELSAHPAVDQVAVVAMPDERLGERACCYLVLNPGHSALTLDEIRDYLLARGLAVQKVPERLEVVSQLPTTATGKIQKNLLRDDIRQRLSDEPS
ncbi:AMP-binding protein [Brevibacterium aurantiacum]|uniref:Cyclohexanecarboxylate-CoA ligase n=1 Tax=Brevibacterium aurantiacum TaxID=273384 RepID=A0A4Z0KHQ3_BREAU|nr:AMP-binding protein [Brevibacterium aurantiacum]TGD37027.1 cyclohexanecarboxylate-CoA ligase [Brevibacterium aurantiacum]